MLAPILRLAHGQHGLVTLGQFRQAGGTRAAWHRLHHQGVLHPVHPGVSRLEAMECLPEQHMLAAVLAARHGGLASHLSAAQLWGADVAGTDPVDLTLVTRDRRPRLANVRLHRPRDLDDLAPVLRARVPATNPVRTALDVGAVASPATVARVLETFFVQRYFTLRALEGALERHSRQGRTGLGHLRLVLDDWLLGAKPPDSVLEQAMARLLRGAALPLPRFHHIVPAGARSYELDFAYVEERVDLEVDGWAHHGSRESFEADRRRDADLSALGWVVIRFTWYRVVYQPHWVAERVAAVLQQRSGDVKSA